MDRLPRDIAQERMHHDIVRLMDEYNLVRSPAMPGSSMSSTLSPPLCSPNGYLGNMKPSMQNKKPRKPGTKGIACKDAKDLKAKKKKGQDGKGSLLDSSAVLSPVDSLESPRGYISDVASPPLMPSPYQQSPSVTLNHLQGVPDAHIGVNHLGMAGKQELAHLQFDPLPPRLTHLPVSGSNNSTGMNDWLSRLHGGMAQQGQFGVMRSVQSQPGMCQPGQHNLIPTMQMINYQNLANAHLTAQQHILQPSIQLQHQNSNPNQSQNFIGNDQQQSATGGVTIHTILPQETQVLNPQSLGGGMASTQFLTPPSQHSYSGTIDTNTPSHQLQVPDHPFLTPSPGSPDQWSSSSPHSNMSDWSEGISSPPTSMHSQITHIPEQFK